jgi:dTMP kinase
MTQAFHICFEGTEGCYKTTNAKALADSLRASGNLVLETKEPGTSHLPLTMILRGIMLDSKYNREMTRQARELISQAIRSIHLTQLLIPASETYDYIVQDRGILSGIAYGVACGNTKKEIDGLLNFIYNGAVKDYDLIIYLKGDAEADLKRALTAKQEFETGDAMEGKGLSFIKEVEGYFYDLIQFEDNVVIIDVVNKSREEILQEILQAVNYQLVKMEWHPI